MLHMLALAVADLGVMYLELFRVWFEWTHLVDPGTDRSIVFARWRQYVPTRLLGPT